MYSRRYWPGPLNSLSHEQLLERGEMRLHAVRRRVGRPEEHADDVRAIRAELERRRDAKLHRS